MREKRKDEMLKQFSTNLKNIMEKQKITQAKISRDLGLHKSSVSQWVNGENFPNQEKLKMLADYLGATTDELMGYNIDQSEYQVPEQIETYQEAIDFLSSLNLLRAYGGLDVNSKSEEDIINLARTIHSVLKMQGAFKK